MKTMKSLLKTLVTIGGLSGVLMLVGCAGTGVPNYGYGGGYYSGSSVDMYGTVDTGVTMLSR